MRRIYFMEDYTLKGTYTLPSLGMVYSVDVNPEVTLRSMTTNEEMKRLNHSDNGYAVMAEVIDDCIIDKLPISAYDMCLADYQFLLHRLRVVTYGSQYKLVATCPYCGSSIQTSIDLDSLEVTQFNAEEFEKYLELDLPQSKKHIKLKMQTPRMLDRIAARAKEQKRKTPDMVGDPAFLFTLAELIYSIDGEIVNPYEIDSFVRSLPMMDANYILRYSQKLVSSFGINTDITLMCNTCGLEHQSTFRTTAEFYGPSIDF